MRAFITRLIITLLVIISIFIFIIFIQKIVDNGEALRFLGNRFIVATENYEPYEINKYDIACLEYVYPDSLNNFKLNVEDTLYKLLEDNTYGKRKQNLPIVNKVEVTNIEKSSYTINEENVDSYNVNLNWEYVTDLGYDKNATLTLVKKENKLYVVEYKAGVVNE